MCSLMVAVFNTLVLFGQAKQRVRMCSHYERQQCPLTFPALGSAVAPAATLQCATQHPPRIPPGNSTIKASNPNPTRRSGTACSLC